MAGWIREKAEGLVDGIRRELDEARTSLDIEAGPLLHAVNMVPSGVGKEAPIEGGD